VGDEMKVVMSNGATSLEHEKKEGGGGGY